MKVFEREMKIGLVHCNPAGSRITLVGRIYPWSKDLKVHSLTGSGLLQGLD
jgi:hypothetical protein